MTLSSMIYHDFQGFLHIFSSVIRDAGTGGDEEAEGGKVPFLCCLYMDSSSGCFIA